MHIHRIAVVIEPIRDIREDGCVRQCKPAKSGLTVRSLDSDRLLLPGTRLLCLVLWCPCIIKHCRAFVTLLPVLACGRPTRPVN
jgi:hypothetical protein